MTVMVVALVVLASALVGAVAAVVHGERRARRERQRWERFANRYRVGDGK